MAQINAYFYRVFFSEFDKDNRLFKPSNKELWNLAGGCLSLHDVRPGIISRLSDYIVFNHQELEISDSKMTMNELKLLLSKNIRCFISIHNLTLVNDQFNEISDGTAFELLVKNLTKISYELVLSFNSRIPSKWAKILYESGCKFRQIYIRLNNEEEELFQDAKSMHGFISSQKDDFMFYVRTTDYQRRYHPDFFNYFMDANHLYYLHNLKPRYLVHEMVYSGFIQTYYYLLIP